LREVSFEIKSGECLALLGQNGSGKTTIARLLLGLERPTRGQILIDGRDLFDLDLRAYRRTVGIVLQENMLVFGTIGENIALGDTATLSTSNQRKKVGSNGNLSDRIIDASPVFRLRQSPSDISLVSNHIKHPFDRVVAAARLAGAHEFISSLPHGYDTMIGELGSKLSGGQRQRIALARALYRNPQFLILDEATNAQDQESRSAISQNWSQISAGRTVLIIGHEEHDILACDGIMNLKGMI
jgi:subfamily B ATP-binding cassette protein HlyB/CyaB